MLQIVPGECKFEPDFSRGVVVIESSEERDFGLAFHELGEITARTQAQGYAASRGVVAARINGNTEGPYPVNSDGVSLDKVVDASGRSLPPTDPKMQPHRYRLDIPVCQPLR